MLIQLAMKSLWNRKSGASLGLATIALATFLLLSVEKLRSEAYAGFAGTISGVDLIVGARGNPVQLLLYSVFRIGNPTTNVSWESYRQITENPAVSWSVPLSLGDSHKGYPVLGTTTDYFTHYRYGNRRTLEFTAGEPFKGVHDIVLGADVATSLGYDLGSERTLSHGTGAISFLTHDEHPFIIKGILNRTGTPVDRTLHISLQGFEAMHQEQGHQHEDEGQRHEDEGQRHEDEGYRHEDEGHRHEDEGHRHEDEGQRHEDEGYSSGQYDPEKISAFMLGLHNRAMSLGQQRAINDYMAEPLMAILPTVVLQQLWGWLGTVENALLIAAILAVIIGILGMLVGILSTLNERRREIALLRTVGARPGHITTLLVMEAALLGSLGALLGAVATHVSFLLARPIVTDLYGLYLPASWPSAHEWLFLAGIMAGSALAGLIPAWRAYRNSLIDGLTPRL